MVLLHARGACRLRLCCDARILQTPSRHAPPSASSGHAVNNCHSVLTIIPPNSITTLYHLPPFLPFLLSPHTHTHTHTRLPPHHDSFSRNRPIRPLLHPSTTTKTLHHGRGIRPHHWVSLHTLSFLERLTCPLLVQWHRLYWQFHRPRPPRSRLRRGHCRQPAQLVRRGPQSH